MDLAAAVSNPSPPRVPSAAGLSADACRWHELLPPTLVIGNNVHVLQNAEAGANTVHKMQQHWLRGCAQVRQSPVSADASRLSLRQCFHHAILAPPSRRHVQRLPTSIQRMRRYQQRKRITWGRIMHAHAHSPTGSRQGATELLHGTIPPRHKTCLRCRGLLQR